MRLNSGISAVLPPASQNVITEHVDSVADEAHTERIVGGMRVAAVRRVILPTPSARAAEEET